MLQIYKIKTIPSHFLKNFLTIFGDSLPIFGDYFCSILINKQLQMPPTNGRKRPRGWHFPGEW